MRKPFAVLLAGAALAGTLAFAGSAAASSSTVSRPAAVPTAVVQLPAPDLLAAAKVAVAAQDPNPPYRATSDPGGYPLHGVHQKRASATIVGSSGLQFRKHKGIYQYRGRAAVAGDGNRVLTVRLTDLWFHAYGFKEYRRCKNSCLFTGKKVVVVGTWHRIYRGEDASFDFLMQATYPNGMTSNRDRVYSWRMRAPGIYPVAGPVRR